MKQFPGHDLPSMLAKFSLPVSLAEFRNPLEAPAQEVRLLSNTVKLKLIILQRTVKT